MQIEYETARIAPATAKELTELFNSMLRDRRWEVVSMTTVVPFQPQSKWDADCTLLVLWKREKFTKTGE